jgi:hypothetical protein
MSRLFSLVAACLLLGVVAASAQTPVGGKLLVTVVDQGGGVIPNAVVTLTGLEAATKAASGTSARTSDKGVATFDRVAAGRYAIVAEFPGFNTNFLKDVTVKAGDNKHAIVLGLKAMQDSATVTQDKQQAASSRDVLFGSALTREQIDALSDDPQEMQRQLQQLAGGDATIRVDSFEGQDLPNKAQIKSIHISRDQFAAEGHSAGGTFIDIITQPGIGPLRTTMGGSFHNNAMEAKNPFAPAKGPSQNYNWRAGIGGALVKDRAQFSVNANQFNSYTTPNLYAATPSGGTDSQNLNLRQLQNNVGVSGQLDYAVTKDQTIRASFSGSHSTGDNQGVGNFDRIEKAYSTLGSSYGVRMTEAGPLGRRFFINTRVSLTAQNSSTRSVSEAVDRNVPDAFNEGGAQRKGGTHTKNFLLGSDLDYVRGKNSWRAGVQIDGSHYRSDAIGNYNGTYFFESLAAYNAGAPRSFTQRVGNPNIEYWQVNVGMYLQDDIRLRKNLSLSPGVRVEAQSHLKDYRNIGPRFGATWSPFKSGKTSLRGSWGIFYDWVSSGIYQQTVQNDGFHLLDINIANPTFPTVPDTSAGTVNPVNRYQYGANMAMVRNMRVAGSINQTLTRRTSLSATVSDVRAWNLLVGRNRNAPVGGLRPNPVFANILETNADGRSRTRSVSTSFSVNLAPMAPASGGGAAGPAGASREMAMMMAMMPSSSGTPQKLFEWRRGLFVSGNYSLSKSENNTDGAFAVPASGNLALEWGPSSGDIRHRVGVNLSSGAFKNINLNINANWSSAPPITIRTGTDDNGDLIFNDRPAGVGRNSARTVSSWDTSAFLSYSVAFGRKQSGGGAQGVMILSGGTGVVNATTMSMPAQPRYRLGLSVSIQNLTNHQNPAGFSGVRTSPFFMKPTTAFGQRSVNFSMNLSF